MRFNQKQHFFAQVPQAQIERSAFDRSHGVKTTFNAGYLVPIYVDEALPGDTHNLRLNAFCRLSTPIRPIMDNIYLDTFFFAVPLRLIWNNFQKFMGEQINPGDSTSYLVPQMVSPAGGYVPPANWLTPTNAELAGALSDYFGIPTRVAGLSHSSFWHRAYNLIWNEHFRDENLQNSLTVDKGDGPDTYTNYILKRRGKRHDYFTSCLPWPQKGSSVVIPLGTAAPIKGLGVNNAVTTAIGTQYPITTGGSWPIGTTSLGSVTVAASASAVGTAASTAFNATNSLVYADLTAATAATINQLRQAFQIQRAYERDARGGTRYTEILHSHFGVISPDARLQRPEYLGGGTTYVNFTPIAQTSANASQPTPQGNLGAMAVASINGNHGFVKSFTEHCVILGFVNVRADMTYQYGLNRMFTRQTRWDYYWPVLAHIGEQAVPNVEIYAQGTAGGAADASTFGFQERGAEYRYKPSQVTGRFRSNDPLTLDTWHVAQKFASLPVLGDAFIQEAPPIDRIQAVTTEPQFLFDAFIQLKSVRPMPVYSVPGQIDHF